MSIFDKWSDDRGAEGWVGGKKPTKDTSASKPYVAKSCIHDGSKPSFTIQRKTKGRVMGGTDTIHIYGARGSSLMGPMILGVSALDAIKVGHLDLCIDMSGMVKKPKGFAKLGSWGAKPLNDAAYPKILSLDWPDMSAPTHVKADFWVSLLAMLPKHTCISCIGSHGRTGTAMACLLVASGMSADKAISTVREQHCKHAIETAGQVDYIRSIARQILKEKG